jgi:hypothetical protein
MFFNLAQIVEALDLSHACPMLFQPDPKNESSLSSKSQI